MDLYAPDPATLSLRDVARGLAYTCRYGGHVKNYYSVAEHSVLVRDLLRWQGGSPDVLRAALFHDAAEAYLGDVVAPLKWALRRQSIAQDAHYMGGWPPDVAGHRSPYDVLEDRMEGAIVLRFGLDPAALQSPDLRAADMWALRIEAERLTESGGSHWRWTGELPNDGRCPGQIPWEGGLEPDRARVLWLDAVGAPAKDYEHGDG
ncbi:MAG: hypothetical protein WKF48_05900 [Solirubrobacteraceae bacterium]